jgi:hypothetical protein
MNLPLGTLDPVVATLVLSVCVLLAGVFLVWLAFKDGANVDVAKQSFAVVGVLFGLLAAGGLGSLFANQAAETAASNAAEKAGTEAAQGVSNEVQGHVESAIKAAQPKDSGKAKE